MLKRAAFVLLLLGNSSIALANWEAGLHYINVMNDSNKNNYSISGIEGELGYQFILNNGFSLTPNIRIATGISDDKVSYQGTDYDLELERYFMLSLRGSYQFENGIRLFIQPNYVNIDGDAKSVNDRRNVYTDDEWEFGFGGGLGYRISDKVSADIAYDWFDDYRQLTVGFHYHF
ncbi:outer membrane beta-barrel protein [Parashewanella tropica]|uniref:outer membrane beta-barrel protein n=1 Tax=Parashewanella tropica TaxID=2547970 RepID=UPI00105A1EC5|nr:outer membrane beta-barrel protein [Parashewanella tropica]